MVSVTKFNFYFYNLPPRTIYQINTSRTIRLNSIFFLQNKLIGYCFKGGDERQNAHEKGGADNDRARAEVLKYHSAKERAAFLFIF